MLSNARIHSSRLANKVSNSKARLLAACLLIGLSGCGKPVQNAPPVPEVVVTSPVQREVPVKVELVGQAQGKQDVEIRARVEGYLDSVNFSEGSYVKKGDMLYQIDPKPLQADLANVQARLTKAKNDVARLQPLFEKQAVSRQELDNAISARDAALAQVELATLNLGYTRITSPIDGIVGITQVKAGNLVGRSESTLLTTVSQVDPIVFRVGISEAEYLKLAKRFGHQDPAQRDRERDVSLQLADGSEYEHKGRMDAVERAIDSSTGTLAVLLAFDNPDRLIRPGQYGRLKIVADKLPNALLLPQRAINEIQGLYQVAVVGADNKVSIRMVKVGPRVDNLWVVTEGLQLNERVVAEGLQRVRDGMVVAPKPASADSPSPATAKP
jgi:membrane fusion protein (multidrug efflux system)